MTQILLNPGPVVLSKRVREAMLQPDLCHREAEFAELQNAIRNDLLEVYPLDKQNWAAILMTGSGTAAMEAMMTSLIPDHGKVLIIENGVYGERLTKIAEIHQINHMTLHHEWGDEIDLKILKDELQYHKEISHVAVVHHETTTGRLNDLAAIAEVCKQHDVPILLDGVSSFGAEDIDFEAWNITACAATANKCLHAVPGTSFVISKRNVFEQMQGTPARTLYLNLASYLEQQDKNGTPFTQSVQTFYALSEALKELKDAGGQQQRKQDYWNRLNIVRDGLEKLGINALMRAEDCSCVLNAFQLPDGIDYETLHDALKQEDFVIYAGQGGLAKSLFRISCMGEISEDDMQRFIQVMQSICNR
ncbi:MAG: 2-aminoethylphosphonate-pyruvate transaminase [Gammaproteobacteria bacterium]|jgi:2-aminoethylphosphonate-pyruvate transaminase